MLHKQDARSVRSAKCPVCGKAIRIFKPSITRVGQEPAAEVVDILDCSQCGNTWRLEDGQVLWFRDKPRIPNLVIGVGLDGVRCTYQNKVQEREQRQTRDREWAKYLWGKAGPDRRTVILNSHLQTFRDRVVNLSVVPELAVLGQSRGCDSLPLTLPFDRYCNLLHKTLRRTGRNLLKRMWPCGILVAVDAYRWLWCDLRELAESCLESISHQLVEYSEDAPLSDYAEAAKRGVGHRQTFEKATREILDEVFEALVRREIDIPKPETPSPLYLAARHHNPELAGNSYRERRSRFVRKVRSFLGECQPLAAVTSDERFELASVKCWALWKTEDTIKQGLVKDFLNSKLEEFDQRRTQRVVPAIPLFMDVRSQPGGAYNPKEGLFQYFCQKSQEPPKESDKSRKKTH